MRRSTIPLEEEMHPIRPGNTVGEREDRIHTPLLVIGAGPYGLATAACAKRAGIEELVVGEPMTFWRENMPSGMRLRSGADWHMDAAGVHTFVAYLEERGLDPHDFEPIPVWLFLDYAEWFQRKAGIVVVPDLVRDLRKPDGRFEATLGGGRRVVSDTVVAAPGITHFRVTREGVGQPLSPDRGSRRCRLAHFEGRRGKGVRTLGDRQSALEWAALLAEGGAEEGHVVRRHD